MNMLIARIARHLHRNRTGLVMFALLSALTALVLAAPFDKASGPVETVTVSATPSHGVTLAGRLSQGKLLQGSDGTVYLDVTITSPPVDEAPGGRSATDMVIVLDRSGSMAEANKMPFAKAAIHDVLARLGDKDRFALVSFSDGAQIHSGLVNATAGNKERLSNLVAGIGSGGGTNMGAGLSEAFSLLETGAVNRTRKVLLMSDGLANQGITDPERLANIAERFVKREAVLSTIGMGLGFNEILMSSLADRGMGNYSYLENLQGLGTVLAKDLSSARNIYANSTYVKVVPGDGVVLVDAGGYPITRDGDVVEIATGQLLGAASKRFIMTLRVPTTAIAEFPVASVALHYRAKGVENRVVMGDDTLKLAVIESHRRPEAISSIDEDVYKETWLENNFGRMQQKLSHWVREGKKDKAEEAITEYRDAVRSAAAQSSVPMDFNEVDGKLGEMEAAVEEAFKGGREDQVLKRNRAAKSIQYGAIQKQRRSQ